MIYLPEKIYLREPSVVKLINIFPEGEEFLVMLYDSVFAAFL
jgi:hypothetical protein